MIKNKNSIRMFMTAGILFATWIPCFLAFYPCIYSYDVLDQMAQIIMGTYSAKHPLIHTLLIKLCYEIGIKVFSSATMGMALYALLQMAVLALSFGYGFLTLGKLGVTKAVRIVAFLWFLLFPVHAMLAVSVTKDILFTAFFVVHVSMLLQLFLMEGWGKKPGNGMAFLADLILMLLFRNNALPALLLADGILFFLWIFRKDKKTGEKKRRLLILWSAGICLSLLCLFGLKTALHADGGDAKEALSVPLQQIARVVTLHEEEIDPDLRADLYDLFDREAIFHYEPWLVDQIKGGFSTEKYEGDKLRFWKIWGKLLMTYPGEYFKAFLDNSAGAWNILDETHAKVYGYRPENGLGYLRSDFSYSEYEGYLGGEVRQNCHFAAGKEWYEKLLIQNHYQDLPVIRYLFSPALYNYLLLLLFLWSAFSKKRRELLPVLLPVMTLSFSIFFGPGILVRYLYPVMCSVVLFTGVWLSHGGKRDS